MKFLDLDLLLGINETGDDMSITKEQAKDLAADLIKKSLRRLRQEIIGENEEVLDRVVRQYRTQVARQTWKVAQKWSKWENDGPVLMPDNTRMYYRKGNTEVLIQEYAPQVRLMKFTGSLAKRADSQALIEADAFMDKIYHYSLALPYMVFMFKFVDGMFENVRCLFCDRPLKRLEEQPILPYLSNIDSNFILCLGTSFDKQELERGKITQQVALIMDHFWHSSFKDEWSQYFWKNKTHFSGQDSRLTTLEAWQEASIENPLFVIEDVQWMKFKEGNFGDIVVKMLEKDTSNNQLQEELYSDLVDNFMTDLKKTFMDNITVAEHRLLDQHVNQLADDLLAGLR